MAVLRFDSNLYILFLVKHHGVSLRSSCRPCVAALQANMFQFCQIQVCYNRYTLQPFCVAVWDPVIKTQGWSEVQCNLYLSYFVAGLIFFLWWSKATGFQPKTSIKFQRYTVSNRDRKHIGILHSLQNKEKRNFHVVQGRTRPISMG